MEPTTPMIDFGGITLPFAVNDLLSAGVGLLTIVGPFVLLALAFPLVTRLVRAIKGSFGNSGRSN